MIPILRLFRKFDPVLVSIALLGSFLRSLIPVSLELNSPHDELLGVSLTRSLLNGNWLGQWNGNTLAKPPGYSFFLYFAHFVPIDISLLTYLLYLAVAFYLARLLGRLFADGQRTTVIRWVFLLFAFNPAVFGADFSRVHRINLSAVLVLLFACLNLAFLFRFIAYAADRTIRKAARDLLITSAFLGLAYSFLILTRVEAYWVLVIPLIGLGSSVVSIYRSPPKDKLARPAILKMSGVCVAIFVASYLVPITLVSSINKYFYGVYEIENYFTGNFARAVTLWASVDDGRSDKTFLSVSKEQRAAVYVISPTAKSLAPLLEGTRNTAWKVFNCSKTNVCDEPGSWFPWELREAAVEIARVKSEVAFQSFFGTLAGEILSGCRSRQLSCGSAGLAPGAQPLERLPKVQTLDVAMKALESVVNVEQAQNILRPAPADPDLQFLPYWHGVVNFRYVTTEPGVSDWSVIPHAVELLRRLYEGIVPLGLLLFAFCAIDPRTNGALKVWMCSVTAAALIFVVGLGLFEQALGFTVTYSLYALPAQPLVLALMAIGFLNTFVGRGRTGSDDVRKTSDAM